MGGQAWGNVANMPASTYYSGTAAVAAGSGSTYGAVGGAGFDFRVVRYFPAQVAVSVWNAGNGLLTAYNAAVTSYTAAKTTWDAYVAILEKNAKMDAFAAAFSPPKAPTVPPLPNLPWVPAAYSGYVKQTPAENATMLANSGSANTMLVEVLLLHRADIHAQDDTGHTAHDFSRWSGKKAVALLL